MITIYLARHGQTDWNKHKRFQSRNDIPLNDVGLKQAHDLKTLLDDKSIHFDKVFCSPLSRAFETAKVLCGSNLDGEIICDDKLLEVNMGDYEGQFEADLEENIGEEFITWRDNIFIKAAPNGEKLEDACHRCRDFINESLLNHGLKKTMEETDNINILIVAHQGINIALQTVFSNNDKPPFSNDLHKYKQHNDQINIWQNSDNNMTQPLNWHNQYHL